MIATSNVIDLDINMTAINIKLGDTLQKAEIPRVRKLSGVGLRIKQTELTGLWIR